MSYTDIGGKPTIIKDPNAILDYGLDLTEWLDKHGDTLASVTAFGTGITIDSSAVVGKTVVAWVRGGDPGATGTVRFRFTTVGGRTDERTIYLKLRER